MSFPGTGSIEAVEDSSCLECFVGNWEFSIFKGSLTTNWELTKSNIEPIILGAILGLHSDLTGAFAL